MNDPGGGLADRTIPVVPPRLAAAHQAYFVQRDWPAALELWRAAEAGAPHSLDVRLALTHCRIECADPAELATISIGDIPPARGGWLDQYGHLVRTRAFHWLHAREPARAAQLTRLLAVADPHIARFYQEAIIPRGAPTPITPPARADAETPLPFQRELALDDATAEALVERHRARRILLVVRGYQETGQGVVESDVCRLLRGVAQFGVATELFDSHPRAPDARTEFAMALRAAIAAFQPDIIIYDDLLVSGPSADPTTQPLILELLDAARRSFGARLVLTYLDAWYDGMEALIETAAGLADLVHMPHPGLLARVPPALAARIFCYPYPVRDLRRPAYIRDVPLPLATFIGSINWANMSRLVWWAEIARLHLPVDLYPTLSPSIRVPSHYAELMGSYAISINLTRRANERRILTNRTIEAPVFGSLLLEEATEDTNYFMRPFEHYVPFANLGELAVRLGQLIQDAPLRERIRHAGSAWARRHFGDLHFWARLFWRLEQIPARPPPPRLHRYRPSGVVVPTVDLAVYHAFEQVRADVPRDG